MSKKDLVQELRELAASRQDEAMCQRLRKWVSGWTCEETSLGCAECVAQTLFDIADRIEAEYDPKPEPDTVEKVALDMLAAFYDVAVCLTYFKGKDTDTRVEEYRKRLEDLGVTFDE